MSFFSTKKYAQVPTPAPPDLSYHPDSAPILPASYNVAPEQPPSFHGIGPAYPYSGYQDTSYDSGKPIQWMEQTPLPAPYQAGQTMRGRSISSSSFWFRFWEGFEAVIAVALVLPFLVLAGVAAKVDGEPISDWGERVKKASLLGPSFFPIIFAGVISHSLVSIAGWLLEVRTSGVTIGTLEALMGSKTISGTLITQICLRKFGFLAAGLVCLWALSPLGGQASLRLLYVTDSLVAPPLILNYQNTTAPYFSSLTGANNVDAFQAQVESVFTAALLSDQSSTMDPFGNVRIPFVEGNASFVSLVGVPVQGLPANDTTKFTIDGAYMSVTVDTVSVDLNYNASAIGSSCNGDEFDPPHLQFNQTTEIGDAADGSHTIIMHIPSGAQDSGTTVFNLTVRSLKASYDVTCTNGTICSVTGFHSTGSKPTIWAERGDPVEGLFTTLQCVDSLASYKTLTKAEQFLLSGTPYAADPVSRFDTPTIYPTIDRDILGRRVSVIFNTYYWASASLSPNLAYPFPSNITAWESHATTTAQHFSPRYRASRSWTGLLVVCSLIAIAMSFVGSILKALTSEVEILGFVSSFTRDNRYFNEMGKVDCVDSGFERSRKLRDRKVCIGDTAGVGMAEGGVGHIAFCAVEERKERVHRRRKLYAGDQAMDQFV